MEDKAVNLSLGNSRARDQDGGDKVPNSEKVGVAERLERPDDSKQPKCRVCAWYPESRHKWKPRKFHLVNP